MVSQGLSFTIVFLLATLITLGEANNNRKLLQTYTNYQPEHSPLPSPVYSPPADLPPPPPTPFYSPPVDLPLPPTPIYPPPPQAYQAYYYRRSPPPPARPWWWLI
ncbi:PREDICTED: extensin-like isoform X2 [Camelina sativa]|uniref:Extensin-like isoform X2 n=1 Tax=Camelina sativa TaxID=90675 RepID=A0ABM0W6A2_CAMSA|nr:PREDICTED: extensin-like isoform X2 [Camelina sativa]